MQLGLGVLGLEDAAERGRAGRVHGAGRDGPARRRGAARAPGPAPAQRADFFDALVALGMLEREDGRYANTPATDLFLDRAKPSYVGGMLEMANARLYRLLGIADRGPADRRAAERGQDRRRLLRRALRGPGAARAVRARHDRRQHGRRRRRSRAKFPWRNHQSVSTSAAPRARAGPDRAGARAHDRRRLRPARRRADLRRVRRALRPGRPAAASPPATSSPTRCPRRTCS